MTNWEPTAHELSRSGKRVWHISLIIEVMWWQLHTWDLCVEYGRWHKKQLVRVLYLISNLSFRPLAILDQSRRTCNKLISRSFLTIHLIYSRSFYHLTVCMYIPFIRSLLKCHKFIGQHSFLLRFIYRCPFAVKAFCWAHILWLFRFDFVCVGILIHFIEQLHASRHLLCVCVSAMLMRICWQDSVLARHYLYTINAVVHFHKRHNDLIRSRTNLKFLPIPSLVNVEFLTSSKFEFSHLIWPTASPLA